MDKIVTEQKIGVDTTPGATNSSIVLKKQLKMRLCNRQSRTARRIPKLMLLLKDRLN